MSATRLCPCGCGAEFEATVAERERGLRAETLALAPSAALPGREHAAAYLISGVPGAGKSTVARLLALHFDRAAHVDIDMVYHHFTVTGLAPPAGPGEDTRRQSELAVVNAGAMARNYVGAGYVCVLEGAIVLRAQVLACRDAVAPHPLHLVVLAPPGEVAGERDARRSGKHVAEYFRHLGPVLGRELGGFGLWIDSGGQTPLETVRAVLTRRSAARLPGLPPAAGLPPTGC
jgi:predicted kinase